MSPENVLITGGTGLIGKRLTAMLQEHGHNVVHLSRSPSRNGVRTFLWDVELGKIDSEALKGITAIVHLAGSNVGDHPWTKKHKQDILESRVYSTALLNHALKTHPNTVKTFVSASGVNYYGFDKDDSLFKENDEPGNDFLANVVVQWEHEVDKISDLGMRVVKMRTGFVLSKDGGALKELARPVKFGFGAALGTGNQRLSWIHIDDLCAMYIRALENEALQGVFNAVGPYPVSNKDLTKSVAKILKKPLWLPNVPSFVLRMLLGEMADLVLQGTSVSSEKIQSTGFVYKFDTIEKALTDIYTKA